MGKAEFYLTQNEESEYCANTILEIIVDKKTCSVSAACQMKECVICVFISFANIDLIFI